MWLVEMAVLSLCVDLMFPYVPLAAADSQPYGNVLVMIIVTFSPSSVFFFLKKQFGSLVACTLNLHMNSRI
jgi:hypothetical protein